MIYVVLGMHKSGTTLVSQTLHKSGISMGAEFDERVTYDQGNQWERRAAWLINLEIVGAEEKEYWSVDCFTRFDGGPSGTIGDRMRTLCAAGAAEADDWGFKDPLTCLTYAQWSAVLPPHRVIAVHRDPGEVIQHYRCRGWDVARAWRVLRAWTRYNEGILDALDGAGSLGICLRYEALMRGDDELARLREFVGRDLVDVRHAGSYRARTAHPLFRPVGRLMAATTDMNPTEVAARLAAHPSSRR